MQLSHLAKVYLLAKSSFHLKASGDGEIIVYLGSLFQCLNTLIVNSEWHVSHLIFSDFELHSLILAVTYFS